MTLLRAIIDANADMNRDPAVAAQALIGLTFAGTHPVVSSDRPLASREIVDLLLGGVLAVEVLLLSAVLFVLVP